MNEVNISLESCFRSLSHIFEPLSYFKNVVDVDIKGPASKQNNRNSWGSCDDSPDRTKRYFKTKKIDNDADIEHEHKDLKK